MAEHYAISRADMLRLIAVLQRQPIGVRCRDGRLRVTEQRRGVTQVTDIRFRPLGVRDGR